jgi:hypothetical protein
MLGCEGSAKRDIGLAKAASACACVVKKMETNVAYEDLAAFDSQIQLGGTPTPSGAWAKDIESCGLTLRSAPEAMLQCVVHIYFDTNVTGKEVNAVGNRLARDACVKKFTFRTREQALQMMKRRFPDLVKNLAYNPLPASYDIFPTRGEYTAKIADTYQHPLPHGVHNIAYGDCG